MANEIELKLALGQGGPEALRCHPRLTSLPKDTALLGNTYFDTPEGDLERAQAALRLRRIGDRLLQTVKTRGQGSGGLTNRAEWEWPVPGPGLDLDGLARLPLMNGLDQSLARLQPRFATDFQRETWLVEGTATAIEVALDLGEIRAGDDSVPIRELELELKRGTESDLHELAEELAKTVPLRPVDTSKAARGSALLAGTWHLPEGGTPSAWLHRAGVTLDALADTADPDWRQAARSAFQGLADASDDTVMRDLACQLAQALDSDAWLDADFGSRMLGLTRYLREHS